MNRWPQSGRLCSFRESLLASVFSIFHNSQKTHILPKNDNAKYFFLHLKASDFGIENASNSLFFQDTFLYTLFWCFMLILFENGRFGDRFKIQRGPRSHPKSSTFHRFLKTNHESLPPWRVLFATCFSTFLLLAPFLIDHRFHFIKCPFPLGSFWKGVAVKVGSGENGSSELPKG